MQQVRVDVNYLKEQIESHHGMQALNQFGERLKKQVLSQEQLKILFASLWAFYHETPSGILCLSLRVNDFWNEKINPWDAMEKAAYLLSASVDEFGLNQIQERFLPTHHQLFLQAAEYYRVSKDDILSDEYRLASGQHIGKLSREYYRNKSLALGLGFHYASELTSYPEFKCLFAGFSNFKNEYQLTQETDPGLKFFWVHTLVEPMHLTSSEYAINSLLKIYPEFMDEMLEGAMTYMNCYAELFGELARI